VHPSIDLWYGSGGRVVFLPSFFIYPCAQNPVFKTQPLDAIKLCAVLALSSVVFFSVELEKLIKRRQKA